MSEEDATSSPADNPTNEKATLEVADTNLASLTVDTQPPDASPKPDSVETLKAKLADEAKARQTAEKSYRELQSLKDRQLAELKNEMGERLARMEGQLTERGRGRDADAADAEKKAWDQYIANLAEKAEEHPREIAEALRDVLPLMRDDAVRRAERTFGEKLAAYDARLKEVELAPIKQQHKDTIDALVKDGIPEDTAIQVAKILGKSNKTIHQPEAPAAPGRTADAGRKPGTAATLKMPVVSSEHAAVLDGIWSTLGLNDSARNSIILNTAKEAAQD